MTSIEVGAAEFHVDRGETILTCLGLGSCICLALWDPMAEVGGMAHIVLPDSRRYRWQNRPGMFADRAPAAILAAIQELGGRRSRITAKIVGGANLFASTGGGPPPFFEIGRRNIAAVVAALQHLRLPIVGEDVGGTCGRSIEFSVLDGRLRVRMSNGIVQEL